MNYCRLMGELPLSNNTSTERGWLTPTSGDPDYDEALDRLLSALSRQGIAVVMSSHDLNHTLRHAHRVWLLKRGQLIASGTRDSVLTPPNLAKAYDMSFRRLDIEGHRMIISTSQE